MDDFITCSVCGIARERLLEIRSCEHAFCDQCLHSRGRCPTCGVVFSLEECRDIRPMKTWLGQVLVSCPNEGCDHQCLEILLSKHLNSCSFSLTSNPLAQLLEPDNVGAMKRKRMNIFSQFAMYTNVAVMLRRLQEVESPAAEPSLTNDGEGDFKHIVLETDTLQGISLRYGVSVDEVRRKNRMDGQTNLHERAVIRIPRKEIPSFTERDAENLAEMLKRKLIGNFKRKTSVGDDSEALYYLEDAEFELEDALKRFNEDRHWECVNCGKFKSAIPPKPESSIERAARDRCACIAVF